MEGAGLKFAMYSREEVSRPKSSINTMERLFFFYESVNQRFTNGSGNGQQVLRRG
jgi:hypothetical protein